MLQLTITRLRGRDLAIAISYVNLYRPMIMSEDACKPLRANSVRDLDARWMPGLRWKQSGQPALTRRTSFELLPGNWLEVFLPSGSCPPKSSLARLGGHRTNAHGRVQDSRERSQVRHENTPFRGPMQRTGVSRTSGRATFSLRAAPVPNSSPLTTCARRMATRSEKPTFLSMSVQSSPGLSSRLTAEFRQPVFLLPLLSPMPAKVTCGIQDPTVSA